MLLSEIDRYGFDVGAQPARDFIRSPFPIGTLDPISGLVELKQLDLFNCRNLTGAFGCGETTTVLTDWRTQGIFKHFRI